MSDDFPALNQELIEILFDRMPAGLAILDRGLILRRANPTWAEYVARYTRTPIEKVKPGADFRVLAPGTEKTSQVRYERALRGETVRADGVPMESEGIISYWDVVVTPLIHEGRIIGVVDVTTDATERTASGVSLRNTAAELQAIIKALPDRYFRLDAEGRILNRHLGQGAPSYYPEDEMIGEPLAKVLPAEAAARALETIRRVLDTKTQASMEFTMTAGGEERSFEARLLPLLEDQVVAIIREITDRKKAEAALRERHQDLELMVAERTREMATLLEVSHNLVANLDLPSLLGQILDQLKSVLDCSGATIFSLQGEELIPLAHRGPISQASLREHTFRATDGEVNREVVGRKKALIIPDVLGDTPMALAFRGFSGERLDTSYAHIRSWLGVPLLVKDRVIGALTLDHSQPNYYRQHHAELALAFANQAAVAIENANLYEETRRRADESQTLLAVQQAVTSRLDLDSVLQLVADEARRLTAAGRAAVLLAESDCMRIAVISGDERPDLVGYCLPVEDSYSWQALRAGRIFRVEDAQHDPRTDKFLMASADIRSFMLVPLFSGAEVIGAIAVTDKADGSFRQEDERVLTMLAAGAAVGLENARLYREEKERRREAEQRRQVAEILRDILAKLNSSRPLQEILDYIITRAGQLLGTEAGAIFRLQPQEGLLTIQAARGLPQDYVDRIAIPMGQGAVGRAVKEGKPVLVNDIREDQDLWRDPIRASLLDWLAGHYESVLAVPLIGSGEVYGGISLYYPQDQDFSEEEMNLAATFASQAALAINNAELRAKAEQTAVAAERSRLARDLHDAVTQTLFSASLIAEVLPRLWDRDQTEGRRRLEEIRQLTRGALAEMRTLLLELRPATLVEVGFGDLLRQLAEATTGRARVPVSLSVQGNCALPPDIQVGLYRIAQEALNNVAKHSGATQAALETSCLPEMVTLRIADNGRGFDPKRVAPTSLGLGIMHERAEAVGARLTIASQPGHGTEVYVVWPGKEQGVR